MGPAIAIPVRVVEETEETDDGSGGRKTPRRKIKIEL